MILQVRQIAVSVAVLFFFAVSIVGWISGLGPFSCCKRALVGALLGYVAATQTVKVINAILVNALMNNEVDRKRKERGDGRD